MGDQARDEAFHFAGDRLGKFVVLGELGRGSMGVVYEAFQEDLKRKVALKVLPANIALDVKQVRRFRREAESVARLQHPNVIQIYEVGQLENTHYFAMELVEGAPFGKQSFIRDRAFVDDAARITRDAARGLAHAHEKGVIHRDMKPGNLLVEKSGRVVVTDFGLARLSESTSLTSTDAIVGTPKYMAPEQILPGTYPLDGRCDVYGLGATLYEAVCGEPPIDAPSVQAFLKAILEERPVWPRKKNRLVPHDLSTIIMRCLEKHPAERYPSAEALADDLDRYLAGERIHAKPKGAVKRAFSFLARHKVVAALSVIALLAGVVAYALTRELGSTQQTSDLRARILQLRDRNALAELEELAKAHPGNAEIAHAVEAECEEAASMLLAADLDGLEENAPTILSLLERAGRERGLWYLMMLFESNRVDDARRVAEAGELAEGRARLVRARLALLDGDFARASEALAEEPAEDAPLEERVFHYYLRGRAERARKAYDEAFASLEQARGLSGPLPQIWLRQRVDNAFLDIQTTRQGSARIEALRAMFRNVEEFTAALLSNLAQIAEDLSTAERRSVEAYIETVLKLAGEETRIASDLIARGEQRVREAEARLDDRGQVLGYLLQAIGMLARGDSSRARDALQAAVNLSVPTMEPYLYWAYSLAARAERNIPQALREAGEAIDFAQRTTFPAEDWLKLGRHTQLLMQQVTKEERAEFVKRVYEPLPEIVREQLRRFISLPEDDGGGAD